MSYYRHPFAWTGTTNLRPQQTSFIRNSEEHRILVPSPMTPGTAGTKIELVSNFYKLNVNEMFIYHYDIEVVKCSGDRTGAGSSSSSSFLQPPQPASCSEAEAKRTEGRTRFTKRFTRDIVTEFLKKECGGLLANVHYAFDGHRNLYSSNKLTEKYDVCRSVSLDIDSRPATFVVTMKYVDLCDMSDVGRYYSQRGATTLSERSVSIYEAILRQIMADNFCQFQRKFFDTTAVFSGQSICEFVKGFTSSVVPTEVGLTMNVHNKTAAIIAKRYNQLLDLVQAMEPAVRDGNPVRRQQLVEVNKFLRHVKFTTTHGNRELRYTFDALIEMNPYDVTFLRKEKSITIAEYFQSEYGIKCRSLPLIKTLGTRCHYIPLELAVLQGTTFLANSKLNSAVQRELLIRSTLTPDEYFAQTTEIATRVANANRAMLAAFRMSLNTAPIKLTGRVLNSPRVLNADNRMPFYQPGTPPTSWCIFALSNRDINTEQLGAFADTLMNRAQAFGLNMPRPHLVALLDIGDRIKNIFYVIQNIKKWANPDFVFLGIPEVHPTLSGQQLYDLIKFLCDKMFGMPNQCFRIKNAVSMPSGFFTHFLLKTNAKLGGRNAVIAPDILRTLPVDTKSTMMIGIDTSPLGSSEQVVPSVVAAVGSLDEMWSQYATSVRVRQQRSEIIEGLDDMIHELLVEWGKTHNQTLPDRLILFRDGVSDGELDQVRAQEIPLIQEGINRTTKSIPFTLILTNKMHSVRFARQTLFTGPGKPTFNVPSGTVVDSTIINPKESVFYLNSHFSQMGTSRPTKYTILQNDLNLNTDDVQRVVFYSCFNSASTRTVISQPTAVRYADLLAYRSKGILEAGLITRLEMDGPAPEAPEGDLMQQLNATVQVDESLRRRLYFC